MRIGSRTDATMGVAALVVVAAAMAATAAVIAAAAVAIADRAGNR